MSAKPLKLAANNPPRSPARAQLAEAIAARDDLERQLAAARDAVEQAQHRKWAAQDKLDALRAQRAKELAARSLGGAFIASVLAGQPCGIDVLERPASTREEDALEREIVTWQETQSECEAEIPGARIGAQFCGLARRGRRTRRGQGFECGRGAS
jgi:hypothetical protein